MRPLGQSTAQQAPAGPPSYSLGCLSSTLGIAGVLADGSSSPSYGR